MGVRIVKKALEAPLTNIARNAGFDAPVVVEEVKSMALTHGFDAGKGVKGDMLKMGVVDPAKVSRVALQNASSVAALLLTSKTALTELKEEKKAVEGVVK
jgi:chaperonin GroEL